jgi:hypothetical protein
MGVPGNVMGGMPGETAASKQYSLPIDLKIKDLSRNRVAPELSLELLLTNTGTDALDVPICLDALKAHAPGTKGRLILEIGLKFQNSELKGQTGKIVDVLFGSIGGHDCAVRLAQGDSLEIITATTLPTELAHGGKGIPITAYILEQEVENERYYVERQSKEVVSPPRYLPNP